MVEAEETDDAPTFADKDRMKQRGQFQLSKPYIRTDECDKMYALDLGWQQ